MRHPTRPKHFYPKKEVAKIHCDAEHSQRTAHRRHLAKRSLPAPYHTRLPQIHAAAWSLPMRTRRLHFSFSSSVREASEKCFLKKLNGKMKVFGKIQNDLNHFHFPVQNSIFTILCARARTSWTPTQILFKHRTTPSPFATAETTGVEGFKWLSMS